MGTLSRTVTIVILMVLVTAALLIRPADSPAVATGAWQRAGEVAARIDRFAMGARVPTGGVEQPPPYLQPLLRRWRAAELWWLENRRTLNLPTQGRKYVMVRASVILPGNGFPNAELLGYRVDVGDEYIGATGCGWTMVPGKPVGLECDVMIEDHLPVEAVELRVGDHWFRFPVR